MDVEDWLIWKKRKRRPLAAPMGFFDKARSKANTFFSKVPGHIQKARGFLDQAVSGVRTGHKLLTHVRQGIETNDIFDGKVKEASRKESTASFEMNINSRTSSGIRTLDRLNLVAPTVSSSIKAAGDNVSMTGFDSAAFQALSNENGPLEVNRVEATEPLESKTEAGLATVSLVHDETLQVTDGKLGTTPVPKVEVIAPLDETDNRLTLKWTDPLTVTDEGLTLSYDQDTLKVNDGELSVVFPAPETLQPPLIRDRDGIELRHDSTLVVTANGDLSVPKEPLKQPLTRDGSGVGLKLNTDDFAVDATGALAIVPTNYEAPLHESATADKTVSLHTDDSPHVIGDALSVVPEALSAPLTWEDGTLTVRLGKGLKVNDDEELETNIEQVVVGRGAISSDKAGSLALEDVLSMGYSSISELFNDDVDVDASGFTYNETLNELHAPHIYVNSNFSPADTEVPTKAYVEQLYQSDAGSPINISGVSNGRRTIDLRTDANLAVENQVLSVNPSPLVDNKGVRVIDGKIGIGLTFQPGNGGLKIENQNQVKLAPNVSGAITFDGNNTFSEKLTASQGVKRVENDLQLDLQAGDSTVTVSGNTVKGNYQANTGVRLTGNTISGAYTAGNNVSISGATISCTYQPEPETPTVITGALPIIVTGADKEYNISKQPLVISGGAGIVVAGSEGTGYVISSVQPYKQKKQDSDPEENMEESDPFAESDPLTASGSSPVVSVTGPLGFLLSSGASLIGGPLASGVAVAPTSAFGALGALAGAVGGTTIVGGFASVFGRERKNKTDASGNPIIDANNNPVLEDGSQVIISMLPKPDDTSCDVTRLLFDTPSSCSYRSVLFEVPQQAVNLDLLKQYHIAAIKPQIDLKFDKTGSLPYAQLSGVPDLSVYEKRLTFAPSPVLTRAADTVTFDSTKITSLGTLAGLTLSGALSGTTATFSGAISSPTLSNYLLSATAATSYQPLNAKLSTIAASTAAASYFLVGDGGAYASTSPLNARSALGLGSLSFKSSLDLAADVGTSVLPEPRIDALIARKTYVDSLVVTAGAGLTKAGTALSVNDAQPGITSLGTLSSLTTNGLSVLGNSRTQGCIVQGSQPALNLSSMATGGASWQLYSTVAGDSLGPGFLSLLNTTGGGSTPVLNVNGSDLTLTIARALTVSGAVTIQATPTAATHAASKGYVDGLINTTQTGAQPLNGKLSTISNATAAASYFLVGDGTNFISTSPVASRSALGLGSLALKSIVTLTSDVTGILPLANLDTQVSTKAYVDAQTVTAGNNLSKAGTVISLNPDVRLNSLRLTSTDLNSSALLVNGIGQFGQVQAADLIVSGNSYLQDVTVNAGLNVIGSSSLSGLNVTSVLNVSRTATVSTPTSGAHAATKAYVDGLYTAGTGLTRAGNAFSVNVAQPQITSVGTLSSLAVSGAVTVAGTANSAVPTAGAMQVAGGLGVGKNLVVAGQSNIIGYDSNVDAYSSFNVPLTVCTQVSNAAVGAPTPVLQLAQAGTPASKVAGSATFNMSRYALAGVQPKTQLDLFLSDTDWGVGKTALTLRGDGTVLIPSNALSVSVPVTSSYTTGYFLQPSLTAGSLTQFIHGVGMSTYNSACFDFNYAGAGNSGNYLGLGHYGANGLLRVYGNGVVQCTSSEDSSGPGTGALQVVGGVGVSKSLFAGGTSATSSHTLQLNSTTSDVLKIQSLSALGFSTIGFLNNTGTVVGAFGYAGTGTSAPNAGNFFLYSGSAANFVINSNVPSVQILSTADSSSSTSGAFQVKGGAGFAGNVNVGKDLTVAGTLYSNITSAGPIVASHLGAPNLAAGSFTTLQLGTGASTNNMARLYFNYAGPGLAANTLGLGLWNSPQGLVVDGTGKVAIPTGNLQVNGNLPIISGNDTIGPLSIDPNFTSNNYVRVWDDLRVVGDFSVYNSAEAVAWLKVASSDGSVVLKGSSDTSAVGSGALQVSGGASVAKSLYVGPNLNVAGDLLTPALTSTSTLVVHPTTPATNYSWNGYSVTYSSEYTYNNSNGIDGLTGHGCDCYMYASYASRLRWATSSTSTGTLSLDSTAQSLHFSLLRLPTAIAMAQVKLTAYLPDGVLMPTTFTVVARTSESSVKTIATFSNISASSWLMDGNSFSFSNTTAYPVWGISWQYANQTTAGGVAIRGIQWNQLIPKAALVNAQADTLNASTVTVSGTTTTNSLVANSALCKGDLTCSTNMYCNTLVQSFVAIKDWLADVLVPNANGYTNTSPSPIGWIPKMSACVAHCMFSAAPNVMNARITCGVQILDGATVVAAKSFSIYGTINNYNVQTPFCFQLPILFNSTSTGLTVKLSIPTSMTFSNLYVLFYTQVF
ncbi:uncharacterized protein EV422DRAFT_566502 [Fimicolochytrium jonesii]|uniref:uncharacterized protein n=1 Tax=Fimicolochytrium jonesii TaxID=1396493 RepID=UPI0022FE22DC|nr:uncharacterized protein EV422DRAFT_566502 [Fimicolochytrium jonesii]KAI8822075.1 hypothetical protein EV422DRAFT_566502 [Fimicolochytrium jonesii]